MLHDLMNWVTITNISADCAGEPFYWSSPLGAISLVILALSSLYAIFRQKHDIVNDVYHWFMVGIVCIAFLHIHENSNPRHQMMIIVTALAVKQLWNMVVHLYKGEHNGC